MPPKSSTRSRRRSALSLVICPSNAIVYRLPSLSKSSTRIFLAGIRSVPPKVFTSLHFTTYSCYGEPEEKETGSYPRKSRKDPKMPRIWGYKLHSLLVKEKAYRERLIRSFQSKR